MMRACALLAAVLLAGCTGPAYRIDASRAEPPAGMDMLCEQIPKLQKPAPMGALLEHADHLVGLYLECAEMNAAKAEYIRSLRNNDVD